jgi:RNA polymerase sigma factor (sigma-70 family)
VYRYIYSKVGQVTLAEDLTSEVFLKALRWLRQEHSAESIRGWLYATARTVIADYRRGQGAEVVLPLDVAGELVAGGAEPEDALTARGPRLQVRRLLRLLPERERHVLMLRYLRGYTAAEIAREVGLSATYVRVVQFRALQQAAALERGERAMEMEQEGAVYSERMLRVLARAEEEARALQHAYIGTEHLLLGLLREEGGGANTVFVDMKISYERVRGGILMIVGAGDQPPVGEIALTPRARTALSLGAEEARGAGKPLMEPEHLLVGLLREGGGLAASLLATFNTSLGTVRAALHPTADPIAAWSCSFCGKGRDAVGHLIQGPGWVSRTPGDLSTQPLIICDECVALCTNLIAKGEAKLQS